MELIVKRKNHHQVRKKVKGRVRKRKNRKYKKIKYNGIYP